VRDPSGKPYTVRYDAVIAIHPSQVLSYEAKLGLAIESAGPNLLPK
jgi:hypothetical protein